MARRLVRRDRLIDLLARRWDHAATVVVGGAGVGKTAAVLQAHADSRATGRGDERYVDCRDPDHDLTTVSDADAAIIDHVEYASRPDLRRLVDGPCRVTLVGRVWPLPGLDRLRLENRLLVIEGESLLFDDTERGAVSVDLDAWDGWIGPAVLAAEQGADAARRYVHDEVVEPLSAAARDLLDLVIAAGTISEAAARVATGRPANIGDELFAVPTLVPVGESGSDWTIGACWRGLREPASHVSIADHAMAALISEGLLQDAARFVDRCSPPTREALQRAVALDRLSVEPATIEQLSRAGTRSAARLLLEGYVARRSHPAMDRSVELWEEALALAEQEADAALAIEAVGHLAGPAFLAADLDAATRLLETANAALADAPAASRAAVALASLCTSHDFGFDPADEGRLRAVDPDLLPRHWRSVWEYFMALIEFSQGESRSHDRLAAGVADSMPFETLRGLESLAAFRAGEMPPGLGRADATVGELCVAALIAAVRGRWDEAESLTASAHAKAPAFDAIESDVPLALAAAAISLGNDDPAAAAARLTELINRHGDIARAQMWMQHTRWLFSATGVALADPPFAGELYVRDQRLLAALDAWRASFTPELCRLAARTSASELVASLGLLGAVEVALATLAWRDHAGRPLVADLFASEGETARDAVRLWAARAGPLQAAARRALATVPVPPAGRYDIRLLGEQRVLFEGQELAGGEWNRGQVRSLLAFLAVHGSATRDQIVHALWPDVEEATAKNRLRTTVARLLTALHPDHRPREASAVVRVVADEIALDPATVRIDALEFERALDRATADDNADCADAALANYAAAHAMWRGDYLRDQQYDDWAIIERDRLRSRFTTASLRYASLLVERRRHDEAIRVLSGIVLFEPWAEEAHRGLILTHLARGDTAAARRATAFAERCLREIGGPARPLPAIGPVDPSSASKR